jgi:pimeloyl-ACP methyl ester carboxylesterase
MRAVKRAPHHPSPAAPLPIVFSHGNSFPAGTYRLMFDAWRAAGHTVHAVEQYGHDPRFPVTGNWPHLRDQLIGFIDERVGGPALLVGHSLGGMLSVLAAARRPDLAAGVVLLDSPVIAGWRAHTLRMAKATGLIRRITPGRVARLRRQHWPSRDAALEHFARKSVFARWDPRVLADYVASVVRKDGRQWTLGFDREVEARIYETIPHHMASVLARHPLQCPLAFIGGRQSVEARKAGVAVTRRLAGDRFEWTDGTHLFPMEHPDRAASLVLSMISRMHA